MFQQPAPAPDTEEHPWPVTPLPFTAPQMRTLAGLELEMAVAITAGLDPHSKLAVMREIGRIKREDAEGEEFRAATERKEMQLRADRQARLNLQAERDAYLSSDEGLTDAASRFEEGLTDLDDLPDPEPLIDGFLYRDSLVRTFGPPKSLKSFTTLDMAACISLGIPWQGHRTEQATVLYIVAEGARGVKKRRDAWNEHHDTEMKVIFYPKPVQIADPEQMHNLIAYCRLKQVGYVIFDTQARCTVGVEENDNTEMGQVVAALDILKSRTGACVHLVHHSGGADPKKARGASAFDGAVDAEFYTDRDKTDGKTVKLVTKFQKDTAEAEPVEMAVTEVGNSLVLTPAGGSVDVTAAPGEGEAPAELPHVTDRLMEYLRVLNVYSDLGTSPGDAAQRITDETGVKATRQATRNAFVDLGRKNLAQQDARGKWRCTPLGVAVIARADSDRLRIEEKWVSRAAHRKVSQEVSPPLAKPLTET